MVSYCSLLRELSISDYEKITDLSLLELARLGPKLRYLSAAKCHRLTDLGVTAIAKHCYNIRGCEAVSDVSLQALATNCSKLRSLDIGKCDVTDAGLEVVSRNIPALRKLSVRGCEMVSDRGVESVAQHCHNLHLLNIQASTPTGWSRSSASGASWPAVTRMTRTMETPSSTLEQGAATSENCRAEFQLDTDQGLACTLNPPSAKLQYFRVTPPSPGTVHQQDRRKRRG